MPRTLRILVSALAGCFSLIGATLAVAQQSPAARSGVDRPRANILPVPEIASPAIRRPEGKLFAGGLPMETAVWHALPTNITPDPQTGIGTWTSDQFYKTMHSGRFPDGALLYPAMPFASYTKVTREDSDAIYAYLRTVPAGEADKSRARSPLSLQQPFADHRMAHVVLQRGRIQAGPDQIGPNGIAAPYLVEGLGHCGMCHTDHQRARRQFGIKGLRGRPDPDAELVCAVRSLRTRKRALVTGALRRSRTICEPAYRAAAPFMDRWPRSSTTACNTSTTAISGRWRSISRDSRRAARRHRRRHLCLRLKPACWSVWESRSTTGMRDLPWSDRAGDAAKLPAARRQPVDPDDVRGQRDPDGAQWRLPAGHCRESAAVRHAAICAALSDDDVAAVVTYIRTSWGNRGEPVSAPAGQ